MNEPLFTLDTDESGTRRRLAEPCTTPPRNEARPRRLREGPGAAFRRLSVSALRRGALRT